MMKRIKTILAACDLSPRTPATLAYAADLAMEDASYRFADTHMGASHQYPLAADDRQAFVTAAIGYHIDIDSVAFDAVNDPIGLEKHFSEIMHAERRQLPRVGSTLRQFGQTLENFGNLVEYVLGLFGRVVPCYPGIQFLKVSDRVVGEQHFVQHSATISFSAYLFHSGRGGLDLAVLDLVVAKCQDFQQCQGFLGLFITLSGYVAWAFLFLNPLSVHSSTSS